MNVEVKMLNGQARTIDGVWVSKKDYDECVMVNCKGLLTSSEIESYLESKKHYLKELYDIAKYWLVEKVEGEIQPLVRKAMAEENGKSLELLGKTRSCLSMQEHLLIANASHPSSSGEVELNHMKNWFKYYEIPVVGVSGKY